MDYTGDNLYLYGGWIMRLLHILLIALLLVTTTCAFAGGDKNRGDKGKGNVVQVVGP